MNSIMNVHESRRSKKHKRQKYLKRKIKNLAISVIPFILFLTGITLISTGVVRYIEQESIVSVFLISRDKMQAIPLHGLDLSNDPTQLVETERKTAITEQEGRIIVPFFYIGDQAGVIRMPSVDIDVNVYQGSTEDQFRLGAGHHELSFWPGQGGNVVLATHRTTFFRNFEYVNIGDEVEFETVYGMFNYKVKDIVIVNADDHYIIGDTDHEQLTMYTCYPFTYIGNAPQRYVLICELIGMELY